MPRCLTAQVLRLAGSGLPGFAAVLADLGQPARAPAQPGEPGAGVSKCGTTDLYKKLLVLPAVRESRNKGPHFWDEQHDFPWYLDLYDDVAAAAQTDPQVVSGDASSNTFTYAGVGIRCWGPPRIRPRSPSWRLAGLHSPCARRQACGTWAPAHTPARAAVHEPLCRQADTEACTLRGLHRHCGTAPRLCRGRPNEEVLLPQLIRAVQPEMRVVVMLRDPVARMYSAFWYYGCLYNVYKDYGMTPRGFDRLAKARPPLPPACRA